MKKTIVEQQTNIIKYLEALLEFDRNTKDEVKLYLEDTINGNETIKK